VRLGGPALHARRPPHSPPPLASLQQRLHRTPLPPAWPIAWRLLLPAAQTGRGWVGLSLVTTRRRRLQQRLVRGSLGSTTLGGLGDPHLPPLILALLQLTHGRFQLTAPLVSPVPPTRACVRSLAPSGFTDSSLRLSTLFHPSRHTGERTSRVHITLLTSCDPVRTHRSKRSRLPSKP
jgi:hypothetical protein